MPVVINEIEILPQPSPEPEGTPTSAAVSPPSEPASEQLRRYLRDLEVRRHRLEAD